MCYYTIKDIKEHNKTSGRHFFEEETLRFFNSRILDGVYGGHFFVSSERDRIHGPRAYTLRYAHTDGSISCVGDFQGYSRADTARRAAARAAAGGPCMYCGMTGYHYRDPNKTCPWCEGIGYRD